MKRLLSILLSFCALQITAQNTSFNSFNNSSKSSSLELQIGELRFQTIDTRQGDFTVLWVEGLAKSYDLSNPDLPVFSKLIEVPKTGAINYSITSLSESIVDMAAQGFHNELIPSQRSIFKNENPDKIPFLYNEDVYSKDVFYTQELVSIERLGTMRGKTLARIQIAPFAYNPLTNELKIIDDIEIQISFENEIKALANPYQSKEFQSNYLKVINVQSNAKHDFSTEPVRMIILSDPMFQEALQDFIAWKRRKGFDVIEFYKGQDGVGSSFETMKANVQALYDNATEQEPAPTYLLIVGDHDQIPSFNTGDHVSDLYYCEFDGNGDYFPEMVYGRFSANSILELNPQLEKTMMYEQYTMTDPSYLDEMLLVAGVDASFAPTHGNGQINYGTEYYFNTAHNLTTYTYLYPESASSAAEAAIIDYVDGGVGFANYTAHCSADGWADPNFGVADANALENEEQVGLMIGNCCQSNVFNGLTCFGEALLRNSKGGAVGYIGGSNNTLWDEDYYWGVGNGPVSANPTYEETSAAAYDCTFHENGEQEQDWTLTQGQLMFAGNLAVTESGSWSTQYYWEIYHLLGDPSVMTYYGVPSPLTINHSEALLVGSSSLLVNAEPYTYVALNQAGQLLDASYTDASGSVLFNFDPLSSVDNLEVVATKQNKQPYIGSITMMSPDSPFVSFNDLVVNDTTANGNGIIENGESFSLDLTMLNYGLVGTQGVQVEVSSENIAVQISSGLISFGDFNAEESITVIDALAISLSGTFQDQEVVTLVFTTTDADGNQWVTYGNFIVNAPSLEFASHSISDTDGNGFIDFGELAEITFNLANVGHATSLDGIVSLSTNLAALQIVDQEISFSSIADNGQVSILLTVVLDEDAPVGVDYQIQAQAMSEDGYSAAYNIDLATSNCATGAMEVMLMFETDSYGEEISWTMTDASGATLGEMSEGSMSSSQLYEEVFCMDNNTYMTFEVVDSYGDGVYSEGYSIIICGETVATGSVYQYGETVSFIAGCDQTLATGCTDPESSNYDLNAVVDDGSCVEVSLEEFANEIHIYPNPATETVFVEADYLLIEQVLMMDISGKVLYQATPNALRLEINTREFDPGFYMLNIQVKGAKTLIKQLIIL